MIDTPLKVAVTSKGILELPLIDRFLDAQVCLAPRFLKPRGTVAVAGWGTRRSGIRARFYSWLWNLPALYLEDGFLRSVFPGRDSQPYALVKDREGIYYDATRRSSLETLLNSDRDILNGIEEDVKRAKALILDHRLSKYNHAPDLAPGLLRSEDRKRVLVIDQTAGDSSVKKGLADQGTFRRMLKAALDENPGATVYVKTHPEVSLGRKSGYLSDIQTAGDVVMLREAVNPVSLVMEMNRVYVVTSTMGFEALLAGKPVTCFGLPWYAGWGATDDRKSCGRRTKKRSIEELFAAAYFHYPIYLNPRTLQRGTIFDVIDWLIEQKAGS